MTVAPFCPESGACTISDGQEIAQSEGTTVTLKVQVAVWPAASVAVAVTVVGVPTLKVEPDAMSVVTVACPLLSVAVGVGKLTTALPEP